MQTERQTAKGIAIASGGAFATVVALLLPFMANDTTNSDFVLSWLLGFAVAAFWCVGLVALFGGVAVAQGRTPVKARAVFAKSAK